MRTSRTAAASMFVAAVSCTAVASAKNAIEIENEKPVDPVKDSWLPPGDAASGDATNIGINGVVDVYPSSWSVKSGDVLGVRVSTVAPTFRTRIYRIGWYPNSPSGAVGSRLVLDVASTKGERQPFPPESATTGFAEPSWHDSLTVTVAPDWTPGQYAVRVTTDGGMDAFSHFIVRDDASPKRAAIIYTDSQLTEQAYNPWPKILDGKKQLSGKSTYAYNSAGVVVQASGAKQAVEVSLARPGGENWGLGIWRDWTVPAVQFLEKHGYDVAYATSVDLHDGAVLGARKLWMNAGHDEYFTRAMWDNLAAARDRGLNLAWFSGNDLTWQVRLEGNKMIVYKLAAYPEEGRCGSCWEWGGDPEFALALAAKKAGDVASQIEHLKNVTYLWSGLRDWDPNAPSKIFPGLRGAEVPAPAQLARYAIELEGLMNGPKVPACSSTTPNDNSCNGVAWVVENANHWIYTGEGVTGGVPTNLANGDRIPLIVGYEMDNAALDRSYPGRPATQVILAHTDAIFAPDLATGMDFTLGFNAQYYQHESGARVFAAGTINWFWGVERGGKDRWGGIDPNTKVKDGVTIASAVTAITTNVLGKLQEGPGAPPLGSGLSATSSGGCGGSHAGLARNILFLTFAVATTSSIVRRRLRR